MLSRIIELVVVLIFNSARRLVVALSRRRRTPALSPPDQTEIGRTIPAAPGQESRPVSLSDAERLRHLYVLGATGAGKTNLLLRLISCDIERQHAFCVVDLRGDLVDRVLLRLAAATTPEDLGRRLLLLDLREGEQIVAFNPLLGSGDVYSRALHVLSVLRRQSDSWGIQLDETLRNALVALAEAGGSLVDIEPLLSDRQFRERVLTGVSDSSVRSFFARYEELSPDKQAAWRLPVLNKVVPLLARPELRLMLGQRTSFSFAEMLDREPGAIILVSLAVDRLYEAAYLVGGLLVSACQGAVMARVDQPESRRVPVHLYVDEFQNTASDRFEAIVSEGRRFGVGLTLSHQNLGQVTPSLRQVLRNNVHTQVYFQTGALDASALVGEICSPEPREAVLQTLITQKVGEAYLVRRGEPAVRITTPYCPDPKVSAAAVTAVREASFRAYARPRREVEADLGGGKHTSPAPGSPTAGRRRARPGGHDTPADPAPARYEIRHEEPSGVYTTGRKRREPAETNRPGGNMEEKK